MSRKTPTDRGYAFIGSNGDGTSNVYVAIGVAGDQPEDVIAVHYNRQTIDLDPRVRTVPAGSMRRTTEISHVFADTKGVVHILKRHTGLGPLFDRTSSGRGRSTMEPHGAAVERQ
jgi:hypothetical protein